MKRHLATIFAAAMAASAILVAQEPEPLRAVLLPDSIGAGHDLLWNGEEGKTYFVLGSENLVDWRFFDVFDQGNPEGHRFWFCIDKPVFFVRVWGSDDPFNPLDNSDTDHLRNDFELRYSLLIGLNPFDADSNEEQPGDDDEEDPDEDGLANLVEQSLGLNPALKDSDGDGTEDDDEDSDQDGLANLAELTDPTDPTDPANPDTDGDGIPDGEDPDPDNPFVTGTFLATRQVLTPLQP